MAFGESMWLNVVIVVLEVQSKHNQFHTKVSIIYIIIYKITKLEAVWASPVGTTNDNKQSAVTEKQTNISDDILRSEETV